MGGLWLEFPKFNHSIGRRILELASAIGGLRVGGLKDSLVSFFQVDFFLRRNSCRICTGWQKGG